MCSIFWTFNHFNPLCTERLEDGSVSVSGFLELWSSEDFDEKLRVRRSTRISRRCNVAPRGDTHRLRVQNLPPDWRLGCGKPTSALILVVPRSDLVNTGVTTAQLAQQKFSRGHVFRFLPFLTLSLAFRSWKSSQGVPTGSVARGPAKEPLFEATCRVSRGA